MAPTGAWKVSPEFYPAIKTAEFNNSNCSLMAATCQRNWKLEVSYLFLWLSDVNFFTPCCIAENKTHLSVVMLLLHSPLATWEIIMLPAGPSAHTQWSAWFGHLLTPGSLTITTIAIQQPCWEAEWSHWSLVASLTRVYVNSYRAWNVIYDSIVKLKMMILKS